MSSAIFPPEYHDPAYATKRLAEIKERRYPDSRNTIQMIDDFEWLIAEAEYLRAAEAADRAAWKAALS